MLQEVGFLALVEEQVGTPDGDEVTRWVVRHPGAVAIVPFDEDERLVLVRQYRIAAGRALLEIPAGKREPGEDPETTAVRELEEETGLRPAHLDKMVEFFNSPGFCTEYSHVFLATDLSPVSDVDHEPKVEERHMAVERYTLDEALDLVEQGEIVDAKSIIGLALARLRKAREGGGT